MDEVDSVKLEQLQQMEDHSQPLQSPNHKSSGFASPRNAFNKPDAD